MDISEIGGTPVQQPYEHDQPAVETVERVNGAYRSRPTHSRAEEIADERQSRGRNLRLASIGLAGLLGASAIADHGNVVDPNVVFYSLNAASAVLTDVMARAEHTWSERFRELHQLQQERKHVREELGELEERVNLAQRDFHRIRTALSGFQVHEYSPKTDEGEDYVPL